MGTKEFFDKGYSLKFLKDKAQADFREDVESFRYVDAYSKRRSRYVPDTDFATASNFAAYGLAELYYKQSIERVYKTYPYDGSLAEKIEWENNSTYLDLYMFENEYPRSNGYVNVNNTYTSTVQSNLYSSSAPQYIIFKGNPHADVSGNYKQPAAAGPSGVGVSKANVYETGSYKTDNLEADPTKGITIEFWMKKDGWGPDDSIEYVFDVSSSGSSGDTYGNLGVYVLKSAPTFLAFNFISGSSNSNASVTTGITAGPEGGLADSKWHHYAITLKRQNDQNIINFYVDGIHKSQETDNTPASAIEGKLIASIGARSGPLKNGNADLGWGGLVSASIDEFRYWKAERNAQQIGRHFRDQIGGGTNTDNVKYDKTHNPVDLGVYFKFNEGITGDDTIDNTVLDYSGRVSNGTFVNYQSASSRNTGSAMISAGVAEKEFKDPILYSTHPDVIALFEKKRIEGSVHDHENATSIFKSLPGWIAEEDEKKSSNLKNLTQIMASVFDEMQLQIKSLPRLKDVNYPYDADFEKPLPFADRLLSTRGIDAPELFADASTLAKFLERDEKKLFEKKLYEVKNTIYQNIYNNLTYIQKSKGTTKSIRNLLRCFGVDEELVKINIYAKNDTYEFKDNVSHTAFRKKYADFDDAETRYNKNGIYQGSYGATVYQYFDPANSNSKSYILGLNDIAHGLSSTLEAEVIFPKRSYEKDDLFGLFPGDEVSLFGLHAVEASDTVLTWANDTINFNVIAVKDPVDNRRVKFKLASNASSVMPELTTTGSYDVYDNEKWNFAFRLRPTKAINNQLIKPHSSLASDVDSSLLPAESAYTVEFYGVNYVSDHLQNEFTLSATISEPSARAFFTKAKRVYAGAHRTNYNGTLIRACDAKISSIAMWYDYLNDEDIKAHGRDASNFGRLHPYKNAAFNEANVADMTSLFDARVPEIDTLIFHWNFENITGSDASGQFLALDISSGSADDRANARYGVLSNVNTYHYSARGDLFEVSNDQVVDIEFVPTAKQKIPEVVNSDDMVKILNQQDDVVFTRDTTYVQHIISVEKSMYQSISNEMMRMFATVAEFNNIIGNPVNRYRQNYKQLSKLRGIFFEIVENVPDLEKYIEYFKWIDDAISLFIFQLLPASSNKVEFLRNMVESHILERSKHFNKFPTIEMFNPEPQEAIKGINALKYNWKEGGAPVTNFYTGTPVGPHQEKNQLVNPLWWKERAQRDEVLTSGVDAVDVAKNTLLKRIITETSGNDSLTLSYPNGVIDKKDGEYGKQTATKVKYSASYYWDRSTSTPVMVNQEFVKTYKGGANPDGQKINDFYKGVIKFGSDNDYLWLDKDHVIPPQDIAIFRKAESSSSIEGFYQPHKREFPVKVFTMTATEVEDSNALGQGDDDYNYTDSTNKLLMPFTMHANNAGVVQAHDTNTGVSKKDYTNSYTSYWETGYWKNYGLASNFSRGETSRVEFNNLHHDVYRPTYEVPMQSPYTHQHVGGNQHRHISLNAVTYSGGENSTASPLDVNNTRPEGWELSYGGTDNVGYTGSSTTNYLPFNIPFAPFNMPPEMSGSDPSPGATSQEGRSDDPSEHDRWVNVPIHEKFNASKTGWRFADNIPDPLGGPNVDSTDAQEGVTGNKYFAYAKKGPLDADNPLAAFGFRSPLIDLLDSKSGDSMLLTFYYHMFSKGANGKFYLLHSQDPSFVTNVTALNVSWDKGGAGAFDAESIQGNQQLSKDEAWKRAEVNLAAYAGTRFYIRFVWMAPAFFEATCAIDGVKIDLGTNVETSFKLLHPTHDDANRPYATHMREEFAKRPVNIKNIQVGSKKDLAHGDFKALQRTVAGNYRNNYEIFHTVGNEANDKTFKEIVLEFQGVPSEQPKEGKQEISSMFLGWASDEAGVVATPWLFQKTQHGTEGRLARYRTTHAVANSITSSTKVEDAEVKPVPGRDRQNTHELVSGPSYREYKQQTRMVNIFSAPGDILDSCAGFKDEAHRTFSAYSALPWRNYHIRQRLKSSLTAHCGRFGAGTHTQDTIAASGSIKIKNNNTLTANETKAHIFTIIDNHGHVINLVRNANDVLDGNFIFGLDIDGVGANFEDDKPHSITYYFAFDPDSAVATAAKIKSTFEKAVAALSAAGTTFGVTAAVDNADSAKINFTQAQSGFVGNTKLYVRKVGSDGATYEDESSLNIKVITFTGGRNATSRVYRSQAVFPTPQPGTISSADYTVVSASFHKYHRNRGNKLILSDATQDNLHYTKMQEKTNNLTYANSPTDVVARGSVYDNAYISHAIPRKNDYPKWIRSVTGLIQEELWLEVDDNSSVTQEVLKLLP